ncbi:MAG: LysR family transcriptional regulator [Solirubrobacteraceae bacterium]
MDERRLEVFRAVAQRLSFGGAALDMHLSQSAVSQQIAALERELGGPLFDRNRRRVRLTAAGAALLARVDGALAGLDDVRRAVAAARGAVEGDLRVSASRTLGSYVLPAALAALARRHPALRLHVRIDNSERVVAALLGGSADVGYVEDEIDDPRVTLQPLLDDELLIVAAASHRFARMVEVSLDELRSEPLVVREPGSGTRRVAEQRLAAAGLRTAELRIAAELTGIEAIKGAVEAGLGVSILSRATLGRELALGTMIARPLAGTPIRRRFAVAALAGASRLPASVELNELIVALNG